LAGFEGGGSPLLLKRILSAVLGIPIFIYLVYEGKLLFLTGMIFLTVTGLFELRRILLRMNLKISPVLLYGSGVVFPLLAYFTPHEQQHGLTLILLIHLIILMITFPKYSVGDLASSYLGSCYIGILLSYIILIRKMVPFGFQYVLLVLILTWACDIGAYFSGRLLGRKPLWPRLSPHKTREGSIGGLILCIGAALLFQAIYPRLFSLLDALMLGILIGSVVQIGDLVESAFKRLGKVKNSGALIPGHGGILDRFDSLLFSAPAAYFYLKFFL